MDARLDQRNCCSSTLQPMLGTALLTLLAMGAPLHAQAGEGLAAPEFLAPSLALHSEPPAPGNKPREVSKTEPPAEMLQKSRPADFNRSIYYKNKLEFSLETGWLPNNIPFVFDRLVGIPDRMTPLMYTLAPIIASLRWQMTNVGGPWILRGNWDLTLSGSLTPVPRGPETRLGAYIMGIRRNFVRPNWRIVPYFEGRAGLGKIDAKGPAGVPYAQGQNFTFTVMLGSGMRYNFNPRYAISAGVGYMHISNLYLSEPKYENYGINVYGPMVGLNVRLGKRQRQTAQEALDMR